MKRDIIQRVRTGGSRADESILTTPAREVTVGPELDALVSDLLETMDAYDFCVGLAAPQIGVPLRVAIAKTSRGHVVLSNPVLLRTSGKKDRKRESCMSLWGLAGDVERRSKAEVSYTDEGGHRVVEVFEGFDARVVQHEIDHLEGKTYDGLAARLFEIDLFEGRSPTA